MKFTFEGFTSLGQAVSDTVEAKDEGHAAQILRDKGIFASQFVPEGQPMKKILPGAHAAAKQDGEMMFPWQDPPPTPQVKPTVRETTGPAQTQTVIMPEADKKKIVLPDRAWKTNLKANLEAIEEVFEYYDKNKKSLPKFSEAQIKTAKADATEELLKQAFMRAVKEAL